MRARAERTPGVDDDGLDAGRGLLPGRSDPETADDDAVMERPPRVLPALGNVLDGGDDEALTEDPLAASVGVDGETAVGLLDAARKEVEQLREFELAAGDDETPQRNALFSFSKKPSSAL